MTLESPSNPGPEESIRLDEAVAEYLRSVDQGHPIPDDEWLAQYPDLRPHLLRFLANHSLARRVFVDRVEATAPSQPERISYFGDFELLRVLGRGGMGVVYLAQQISLDRPVALKMIQSGHLADPDDLRRFRNEAEAVARLDHPNILSIFEIGEHNGHRYFTMPLINGGSLADNLSRFRDDPRKAVRILIAVAEAVGHAHQRGILHRDLKPANILVDEIDRPLVSDFGLSKRLDNDESSGGGILGTPVYMSPEQATGHSGVATTACDIYGLGAILYALLAGRPPFPRGPVTEVLRRVANDPPDDLSKLNRRVDRRLRAICLRCLEKEPKRRYISAEAMAEDLRRWLRGETVQARPAPVTTKFIFWCRRHPVPAALAILLVVAVVFGLGGIIWQWREAEYQRLVTTMVDRYFRTAFLGFDDALGFVNDAGAADILALDLAERKIGNLFVDLPEAEAGVREALGLRFRASGRPDKAKVQFQRSLDLRRSVARPDELASLQAKRELASTLIMLGETTKGDLLAIEAYRGLKARLGPKDRSVVLAHSTVAQGALALGRLDEAERINREIITQLHADNDHGGHVEVMVRGDLALALKADRRFEAAQREFAECLARAAFHHVPESHTLFRNARNAYAGFLIERGQSDLAESVLDPAIRSIPEDEKADTSDALMLLGNLAAIRLSRPGIPNAKAMAARVVRGWERIVPSGHPLLLNGRATLAEALMAEGRWADAVEQYRRIAQDRPANLPPEPKVEISEACQHADALIELNRPDQSLELLNPITERARIRSKSATSDTVIIAYRKHLGTVLSMRGSTWLALGEFAQAERDLNEARKLRASISSPQLAVTESLLGEVYLNQKRFDLAESILLDSHTKLLNIKPVPRRREVERARHRLQKLYQALDKPTEAAHYSSDFSASQ